jgi:hypothetical protein
MHDRKRPLKGVFAEPMTNAPEDSASAFQQWIGGAFGW